MYLLDTDTTSNFLAANRSHARLRERILAVPAGEVYISIVTVEEMFRGQLAQLNTARSRDDASGVIRGYALLQALYAALQCFPILPYDAAAEELRLGLDRSLRRKHGQDCRIAAVAASRGFKVITRNTQDFEKIGLARCHDWT